MPTRTSIARSVRRVLAVLGAAAFLYCAGCGCSTPGGVERCEVALYGSGGMTVGGRQVKSGGLARALRGEGAGPQTVIEIQIPEGPVPPAASQVISELKRGGFRRVVLVRPRRASAETDAGGRMPAGRR
ncbi:MAG: hypothetical protein FJ224_09600 [Lentisphaerae bacterium]|nr:hypothetical protein [Lentisphaerota bacterium]